MYYEHSKGNIDWKSKNKTNKKQFEKWLKFCGLVWVFFHNKKESHHSQNKHLDINVDDLEHYWQPRYLFEQEMWGGSTGHYW